MIFLSCELFTEPDVKYSPTEHTLSNFEAVIVDYDSVSFSSHFDIFLESKSVKEIAFTIKGDSGFVELQRIEPTYIKTGDQYRLDFEYSVGPETKHEAGLPSSSLIENYNINFYSDNGDSVIFEKQFEYYKYPYINAMIHFSEKDIPEYDINGIPISSWWRDFDIRDDRESFVFCQSYRFVIYNYINSDAIFIDYHNINVTPKMIGRNISRMKPNSWQNHLIAVHGNILYYDYGIGIIQAGLDSAQIRIFVDEDDIDGFLYEPIYNHVICGIEATVDYLYILTASSTGNNDYDYNLLILDHNANFVDSFDWDKSSYNLESYNNILYSYAWETDEIIRYDLSSNTFLENKSAPSGECGYGFEIMDGRFYYSDWNAILSIPLEDLEK